VKWKQNHRKQTSTVWDPNLKVVWSSNGVYICHKTVIAFAVRQAHSKQ